MTRWKLVPVEPTEEMLDDAGILTTRRSVTYRAMLAAAPPVSEELVEEVTRIIQDYAGYGVYIDCADAEKAARAIIAKLEGKP